MDLGIRRIYSTNYLFLHDVIHLNVPSPQNWKAIAMLILLFLLPYMCGSLLDKHCFRTLSEFVSTVLSLLIPTSTRDKIQRLRTLLSKKASLMALLVLLVKFYGGHRFLVVKNEAVRFNQPVIYRTRNRPERSECSPMTPKAKRDFLMWEVENCSQIRRSRMLYRVFYIPSIRAVNGSEQRCLQRAIGSVRGRVEAVARPNPENRLGYEHPISLIKEYCFKSLNMSCNFINHARTLKGSTRIFLDSTQKMTVVQFFDERRPGLTVIRELALKVKNGGNRKDWTKTALSVEQAMRHSSCFAKREVVDIIKVPHLTVYAALLIAILLLESLCRRYFKHFVNEGQVEDNYGEVLNLTNETNL